MDEFTWSPIVQSKEYANKGAIVIEEWKKLVGRPITLKGADDRSWIKKDTVLKLQTLNELPGVEIDLLLSDGRAFTTILDNSEGSAFEAKPIFEFYPTTTISYYQIEKLKMITIA